MEPFCRPIASRFLWDYSWWLDAITDSDFKICALFDEDNLIVAGLALPYFSSGNIHQPPLTQSLGMLYEDMSKRNNMRLQKQLTNQKNILINHRIRYEGYKTIFYAFQLQL